MLKFKSKITRIYYPKNGRLEDGDWGIVGFSTDKCDFKLIEGAVKLNSYGQLSIVGNFPTLREGIEYTVIAKEGTNHKDEFQYDKVFIFEEYNFENEEDKRRFLEIVLTESQVNTLYDYFDDPFELIKNKDLEELTKAKGIGAKSVMKLFDKYDKTIDYSKAYLQLENFGLTQNMITKLCDVYGSPEILIAKLNKNPYIVADEVDGIGWKKSDDIAMKMGIDKESQHRIEAYVQHYLKQQTEKGHSYVEPSEFAEDVCTMLSIERPQLAEVIRDMYSREVLYWEEDKSFIALRSTYELEKSLTDEVLRILNQRNKLEYNNYEEIIKEIEEEQGWEFTDEQMDGVKTILENNFVVLTGLSGCVDNETEYFNGEKWVKISKYQEGDNVLQFNPEDKSAEMVKPLAYIKEPQDVLYRMRNYTKTVDQVISKCHDIAYLSSKGNVNKKRAEIIFEEHKNNPRGVGYKFINAFNYNGGKGIELSEEWIRIMVAVFADGSYYYQLGESAKTYNKCRFHIKKKRKKERLRMLFANAGIDWEEKKSSAEGYSDFYIYTPYRAKSFPLEWYNGTVEQFEIILDEVCYWDTNVDAKGRKRFSTCIKQDADFIQFVASSLGHTANITSQDRRGQMRGKYERKSIEYNVSISKNKWRQSSLSVVKPEMKIDIEEYTSHDGYMYCFTIPSGYLIFRREGKIFVSGNCGKSSLLKAVTTILDRNGYTVAQTALAGKASARIEEVTGFEAKTIHRLLEYNPKHGGFMRDEYNPISEDIDILDEGSMVGGGLYYSLLKAVKDGSKFVLVGDDGQLESIGSLNVFYDLLNSPHVPKVRLTKIHRQAQNSAIITESIALRQGKQILERGFVGRETRGVLQDLIIDSYDEKEPVALAIMEHYKTEYELLKDVNKIQIIVPMRENGDISVYNLNQSVQRYVNPTIKNGQFVEINGKKKPYILKVGDKVINKVNNYKTCDVDLNICPIFNGNFGIIKEIDLECNTMEIEFECIGRIVVPKKHWKHIELGYASTVHSMQGSQVDVAIVGLDFSAYVMLTRELPYTAMTRAKKKCYLVIQNSALSFAINNSQVPNKKTFMPKLLGDYFNN